MHRFGMAPAVTGRGTGLVLPTPPGGWHGRFAGHIGESEMKSSNWWRAAAVGLLVSALPLSAAAQGKHAPAAPVMLYEMSENAVLLNAAGNVLVPDPTGQSPTGLVDSTTGAVGIPARRYATSHLQGTAALGTPLCPLAVLVTKPRTKECVVTATGNDDVALAFDSSGHVVATSGALWGT